MQVMAVPCLKDNYAYLVVCEQTGQAAVVDPSEAPPVLQAAQRAGVTLAAILNTHHHWDHTGGNKGLLASLPSLRVYAHASDKGRVDGLTHGVQAGDQLALGKLKVRVLHNPGHTSGAVSYVVEDAVFTGDTMFAAGCGRLFEGTPEMMYRSLHQVIGGLPPATRVFFGHEYTEKNLQFARQVEPENAAVQEKLRRVQALRAQGQGTTPSTLAEEWATNPFLRTDSPAIQAGLRQQSPQQDLAPVAVLATLRQLKDRF